MSPEKKSYDSMHFRNRKDSKAGIPNRKKTIACRREALGRQ